MVRFLAGAIFIARVACQRLDVNFDLCLQTWRNRPVIEVVLEQPEDREEGTLLARLDAIYPF